MQRQRYILVFSTAFHPFNGGAELATKEIARRLYDVQFHVITARMQKSLKKIEVLDNMTIHRLGMGSHVDKFILPITGFIAGRMIIKSCRGQILLWGVMIQYATIAAYWLSRLYRIPLLITLQEGDKLRGRKFGLVQLFWKMILPQASSVHVISTYLRNLARANGYKGKIVVIPNGIDLEAFQNVSEQKKENIHSRFSLERFHTILISVSRLVEKNGLGDVIKALPHLPNMGLLLVGSGPLEKSLGDLAQNYGVLDRTIFVGDVPYQEIPEYLSVSDIFIRPSLSEGLGTAFIEAAASGKPFIATSVGGIKDFLVHRTIGYEVPVHDVHAITTAVQEIVKDKILYQHMSDEGKRLSIKYEWNDIAKRMFEWFNSYSL